MSVLKNDRNSFNIEYVSIGAYSMEELVVPLNFRTTKLECSSFLALLLMHSKCATCLH